MTKTENEHKKMKYEFTGETDPTGLNQIRRISNGELGGWIEKEENLSHEGECWVSENARVSGKVLVSGNAQVSGNARVSGDAWIYGNAQVSGNARVSGDARVSENARVSGDARVYGDAQLSGNAQVSCAGDYMNIVGLEYSFTWTRSDDSIQIGRERRTVLEWWELSKGDLVASKPLVTKVFRLLFLDQKPANSPGS